MVDGEPTKAPVAYADGPVGMVVAGRSITGMTWAIVVLVGVPLLAVMLLGLGAIGLDKGATGLGATILAALVAGRVAGIHGAGRWFLAWLLIYGLYSLLALLLYLVSLASGSGIGPP